MSYIRYRSFSDGTWEHVYCLGFNQEYFYYVQPMVYEWLKKLGKSDQISWIDSEKQPYFIYETHQKLPNYQPMIDETLFHYPIQEYDIPHIAGIVSFFYEFHHSRKKLTLAETFDRAIRCTFPKIPKVTMECIVQYQLRKNHLDQEKEEMEEKIQTAMKKVYPNLIW